MINTGGLPSTGLMVNVPEFLFEIDGEKLRRNRV